MANISEKINKVIKILVAIFFLLFLLKTITTYYSALGQYGTGDQTQFSLPRIQNFLKSSDSVALNEGSNLTYILVALPGHVLEKYLDKSYKKQDKLFKDFQYTEILPYSFTQVTISLILLFYCVFLFGRILKFEVKKDYLYYLLIALIILNYPTLKGDVKILKYDALSLLCSITAILNYLIYLKEQKKLFLIFTSIFSTFAFIEKDITISTIVMIIFFEFVNIILNQEKSKDIFKKIIFFLAFYFSIFFLTIFIMVPQLWHEPGNLTILFKELNGYFHGLNFGPIFFGLILIASILFIIRFFLHKKNVVHNKAIKTSIKHKNIIKPAYENKIIKGKNKYEIFYYFLFVLGIIIFISALLFQKNNMIDMSTASPQILNKINTEQLFVTPVNAQVSISTLDKSDWITRIKIFYNSIRIFIYITPEIIVLLFFLTPLLFIFGQKKDVYNDDSFFINIISLFPVFFLLGFSYILAPIEPKYNLLSYILLIFFTLFILVKTLQNLIKPQYISLILLAISLLMIRPALIAKPAYLGYKNYFRNVEIENTEFLDMNKYNWWMWLGWGETTYPIFKYIDRTTIGKQKILLDYTPPFAENPRFRILYNGYFRQAYSDASRSSYLKFTNNDLKGFLNYYNKDTVNFLLVSKNVANRGVIGNFILKNYRNKAVYIDKICDVEYGWLFKIDNFLKEIQ